MVLFLSKLLELVASPLGVLSMLLVASVIAAIYRRPRMTIAANVAGLALIWLTSTPILRGVLISPLETKDVPAEPLPRADAIVVLGGIATPAIAPQPLVHLSEGADRLVYAAALYRAAKAPVVILSGGKFPWEPETRPPESALMGDEVVMLGVPRSAILEESRSRDSYENARNLKDTLAWHKIHGVLLVTSAIHMPRALAVFRHERIVAIPAPTDFRTAYA